MNVSTTDPDKVMNFVKVLEDTADRLERGAISYDWIAPSQCNCGVVAQSIMSEDRTQINEKIRHTCYTWGVGGSWASMAYKMQTCEATGLPISDLFRILLDKGFEWADFSHLENLSDIRVLREMGRNYCPRDRRENLVDYLRTWAKVVRKDFCELVKQEAV